MADPQSQLPHPIPPEGEEQDVLFKAQMWVYDAVLSNLKVFGVIAGLILLGALVYGAADSWRTHQAHKGAASIAEIDRGMPEIDQMAMMGLVPLDNLSDPARVEKLTKGAEGYEAAADSSSGIASAQAWLKAAETWKRLGQTDKARAAFQSALDAYDEDIVGHAARMGLVSIARDEGKLDEAERLLRESAKEPGFVGESALLSLVELKLSQGDTAAAQTVLDEARQHSPTSPRVEKMAMEKGLKLAAAPTTEPQGG